MVQWVQQQQALPQFIASSAFSKQPANSNLTAAQRPRGLVTSSCSAGSTHTPPLPLLLPPAAALISRVCGCSESDNESGRESGSDNEEEEQQARLATPLLSTVIVPHCSLYKQFL